MAIHQQIQRGMMRAPVGGVQCLTAIALRGSNTGSEPKCCAARTLCYISAIDAKCLEMAKIQGIEATMSMLRARHKAPMLAPCICFPESACPLVRASTAYVFMERIE